MILYERTFFLRKGLSFSRYIKNLNHESFPPYTLLISKTDDPDRCDIEIVMSDATMSANVMFIRGILFNKCIVQYFKSEGIYTVSASAGSGNVIMSSAYVIMAFLMFLLGFFVFITNKAPGQAFYPWAGTFFFLVPLISTYRLEKGLLDKIGFLGSDINEE